LVNEWIAPVVRGYWYSSWCWHHVLRPNKNAEKFMETAGASYLNDAPLYNHIVSKREYSSERGYFSLRWAIPGFILILIVGAINFVPLLAFLRLIPATSSSDQILDAFLTIVPFLVSGPGIGFLVSQLWFFWFYRKGGIFEKKEFKPLARYLRENYLRRNDGRCEREQCLFMEAFSDFAVYLRPNESLLDYAHRRWDMLVLLGSTYWALIMGLVAGWLIRVISGISVDIQTRELHLQLLLLFLVVVFIVVTYCQRRNVWSQFSAMYEALIRLSLRRNHEQLLEAFYYYLHMQQQSG